jgi:hypothetical protein
LGFYPGCAQRVDGLLDSRVQRHIQFKAVGISIAKDQPFSN